jgi:hypothetical protein
MEKQLDTKAIQSLRLHILQVGHRIYFKHLLFFELEIFRRMKIKQPLSSDMLLKINMFAVWMFLSVQKVIVEYRLFADITFYLKSYFLNLKKLEVEPIINL